MDRFLRRHRPFISLRTVVIRRTTIPPRSFDMPLGVSFVSCLLYIHISVDLYLKIKTSSWKRNERVNAQANRDAKRHPNALRALLNGFILISQMGFSHSFDSILESIDHKILLQPLFSLTSSFSIYKRLWSHIIKGELKVCADRQ